MLLTGIFVASCSSAKAVADDAPRENLIIYYDPAVGNAALLESAKNYGSEVIYIYIRISTASLSPFQPVALSRPPKNITAASVASSQSPKTASSRSIEVIDNLHAEG